MVVEHLTQAVAQVNGFSAYVGVVKKEALGAISLCHIGIVNDLREQAAGTVNPVPALARISLLMKFSI